MKNFIEKILSARKPYVIAEAGINHNGDKALAKDMIDAAKENGADCIKFQSFLADKYISKKAGRAGYQNQSNVGGKSQNEIIKATQMSQDMYRELISHANKVNIDILSTPFEVWSFRSLMELKVPAVKISSCNLTNEPFLNEIASTKIPVLISTGMGTNEEVDRAMNIFKKSGTEIILFQCTSNYPSKIENANLNVLKTYQEKYRVPVGLSDHTVTHTTCIAAIALGAIAIEKHFTLSRQLPGIDQKASIEPHELKELVIAVNDCYKALGHAVKQRTDEETDTFVALRRSLVAARDLKRGEVLAQEMIAIKRPGNGLTTSYLPQLIGKQLNRDIFEDDLFTLEDIDE
ncbi:MAG: N-acetylneuraminate synthase family protein [Candidatus Omnitrophica bacterium]|nr:N-acetylneuraminate synthase family protein [Candidatus Omnitrophota bacterium]